MGVLLEADEKVVVPEDGLRDLWFIVWGQRMLEDGRRQNPFIQHLRRKRSEMLLGSAAQ